MMDYSDMTIWQLKVERDKINAELELRTNVRASPSEAEQQWVDARTRKPPPTFDVLIASACGMDIGNWTGHYWVEASTHDCIEFVTHWKPLPPSPDRSEEKGNG
jgi:hypothetical protein